MALLGAFMSMLLASTSFGQASFDEAVDGEISDNGLSPTILNFDLGVNTVSGTIGPDASFVTDLDFFSFNLAEGLLVDSISATRSGPGNQSFFGYAPGTSIASVSTAPGGVTNGDLISNAGTLNPSGITSIPQLLLAGDHTFIVQENVSSPVEFEISFNVSADPSFVPEPSSFAFLS